MKRPPAHGPARGPSASRSLGPRRATYPHPGRCPARPGHHESPQPLVEIRVGHAQQAASQTSSRGDQQILPLAGERILPPLIAMSSERPSMNSNLSMISLRHHRCSPRRPDHCPRTGDRAGSPRRSDGLVVVEPDVAAHLARIARNADYPNRDGTSSGRRGISSASYPERGGRCRPGSVAPARRVGGGVGQVPIEVGPRRGFGDEVAHRQLRSPTAGWPVPQHAALSRVGSRHVQVWWPG